MAENLVKHSGGSRSRGMEELGNEYFDDLVSFSFFQPKTTHWNTSYFIMHDLVIDLDRAVSGKYSCLLEHNEDIDKFEKKIRHLGCVMELLYHNDEKSSFNFEATHLRTFLSLGEVDQRVPIPLEVLHNFLLKLKGLRVLSFRYSHMLELPDSIGKLKYLHYLDLSYTNIVKLPESITVLYNLQTLKLEKCFELQTLPEGMHHLISLRHLIIRGAGLVEMPSQMSKLTKLQILTTFVVGKESGAKIEELAELADLRGELSIEKLENVVNITRASNQASVLYKKQLEKFSLECTKFPNWVGNDSFSNIVQVKLDECQRCSNLPPLGQLASLKHLDISGFNSVVLDYCVPHGISMEPHNSCQVVMVGAEFYGNSKEPFSSLETLIFSYMSSWEEWESKDSAKYRNLKTLKIRLCPKLIGNLPPFLPSLTEIKIDAHWQGALTIPRLPCWTCCPKLTYLEIMDCFKMKWLPVRMASLLSLKYLSIYGCPLIETLPEGGLPICLSTLKISYHELLRINWNWQTLPHLKHVEIEGDKEDLESFPEERLLPTTITSLGIVRFSKLKCLSKNGLTQLTSLQTLEIRSCPELDTLSEEGFPTSLSSLNIIDCPLLEKKYYCSSKISHIPDVTFD
ncbi:putative disease resistance RPP13-like protein 1 [Humulus lupulus]|uniref:putative disease resistance RPP13-like protein 1 n=1 Tax=Humulus lupulus TaxID=3486 RepID=UPI002B40BC12|nr:putative disease resistance RPP13-like protein 1 [Humulus lupulus]